MTWHDKLKEALPDIMEYALFDIEHHRCPFHIFGENSPKMGTPSCKYDVGCDKCWKEKIEE